MIVIWPENIAAMQALMVESPKRSAQNQTSAKYMFDRCAYRILHKSLYMYPYKMMVV